MLGLWKSEDGKVLIRITKILPRTKGMHPWNIRIQFDLIKGYTSITQAIEEGSPRYVALFSVMPKYDRRYSISMRKVTEYFLSENIQAVISAIVKFEEFL